MIERLKLRNFTAFTDIALDFSPKINVIIGENGTGKTHLLKGAYWFCSADPLFRNEPDDIAEPLLSALTAKLQRLFVPTDDRLGNMHRRAATDPAYLSAQWARGRKLGVSFNKNSKVISIEEHDDFELGRAETVFIPTKEVLSFMKGFNSLYERYELSFDQTYHDICLLLDSPILRQGVMDEKSKWALEAIEDVYGGHFVFHGGGKVTFRSGNDEYSANAIAEGFRKVGMLSRLLETGAIEPGISGPLYWDEPEASLNPKLMRLLVEILLKLSRGGQQIILATHDYVLLKWFDLLQDSEVDRVRFHSLYRDSDTSAIKVASTENYLQIFPNPIDEAFGSLVDKEIENDMGNLGK